MKKKYTADMEICNRKKKDEGDTLAGRDEFDICQQSLRQHHNLCLARAWGVVPHNKDFMQNRASL